MRRTNSARISLFAFQDIITSVMGIFLLIVILLAIVVSRVRPSPAEVASREMISRVDELRRRQRLADELEDRIGELQSASRVLAQLQGTGAAERLAALQRDSERLADQLKRQRVELQRAQAQLDDARRREGDTAARAVQSQSDTLRQEIEELRRSIRGNVRANRMYYNLADNNGKTVWLVEVMGDRLLLARHDRPESGERFGSVSELLRRCGRFDRSNDAFVVFVKPAGIAAYHPLVYSLREMGFNCAVDLLARDATLLE